MKISILTVCFNSEETIESTIQSVASQDYSDIEYIIIDGKSSDKTISIIEKYKSHIAKIVSEKDKGIYFAINKGIALATGDIVGILHSDDFYAHEKIISSVVQVFKTHPTDSVYGDLQYVSRNNIEKIIRRWKSNPYSNSLFLKGWMPPHPTFFVKKSCYEKFGHFNTSFSISSDYELMLRFLYKNKASSIYIPKVLVKMRTGGISNATFSNRIKANREDKMAWRVNDLKPGRLTIIAKPLSKLKQFFLGKNN
jgi:glycosyltransferase involved in cell wall biosynthesis